MDVGGTDAGAPPAQALAGASPVARAPRRSGLVALYSATLLLAALLLFSVQPMFTKRVLPLLGGTPGVWSVAMVVFQALLLAGYAYAHVLTRCLPLRAAMAVHGIVLLIGVSALPIAIAAGFEEPPQQAQALWLVGLFLASIGAPYFALSASAPLLQAWFARSGDPHADDPYFLYRASNLGSLAALLAYPVLIEPWLGLAAQSNLWTVGYGALIAAIAACALSLRAAARPLAAASPALAAPGRSGRLAWVALSAVPSGLLVAATAYLSTDVAAVPLLWVVPLALYLGSFILAFRQNLPLPGRLIGAVQVAGTSFLCLQIALGLSWHYLVDLVLVLVLLFLGALTAHRTLYLQRPPAAELTRFYLYTSLGGVLGGIFAALAAPQIFSRIDEFPILLVAALACRPEILAQGARLSRAEIKIVGLSVGAVTALAVLLWPVLGGGRPWITIVMAALLFAFAVGWREPRRVALLGVAVAAATILLPALNSRSVESHRSFFGVHQIRMSEDGRHRLLWHGTTLHGAMRVANNDGTPFAGRPEPTTYYAPGGPMAQALEISRRIHGAIPSVSVVGLGTGSLACNARAGEAWTYYEIDPDVIRIASDPKRFRFLSECVPGVEIVPGDARLTLARRHGAARVLVVDAFSSDAVPMHLLTTEALDVDLAHLDARGLVVFHISNRNFQLKHVLARVAAERGLLALERLHDPGSLENYEAPSQAVIVTHDPAIVREALALGWRAVPPDLARRPWSDDYANAIEAMRDRISPPSPAPDPAPIPVARRE